MSRCSECGAEAHTVHSIAVHGQREPARHAELEPDRVRNRVHQSQFFHSMDFIRMIVCALENGREKKRSGILNMFIHFITFHLFIYFLF